MEHALVQYIATPRFILDSQGNYDAFYCLGQFHDDVLRLAAALTMADHLGEEYLIERNSRIKSAFKELASVLHPDKRSSTSGRQRWATPALFMPYEQQYAIISWANEQISDPLAACAYLLRQPRTDVQLSCEQRSCLRASVALRQRQRLLPLVQNARLAFHGVSKSSAGRGIQQELVVLVALYGDLKSAGVDTTLDALLRLCTQQPWLRDPTYGQDADSDPRLRAAMGIGPSALVLDLTIPCQHAVEELQPQGGENVSAAAQQQLSIKGRLCDLPGSWDPCPGYPKQAALLYLFHGRVHCLLLHDGEGIACPQRKHMVPGVTIHNLMQRPVSPPRISVLNSRTVNARTPATGAIRGAKTGQGQQGARTTNRTIRTARRTVAASSTQSDARALQSTFQEALDIAGVHASGVNGLDRSQPGLVGGWAMWAAGAVGIAATAAVAYSYMTKRRV